MNTISVHSVQFIALLAFTSVSVCGCSGVCNSVGTGSGAFSGGSGWTGIANIGITGIHAGVCGAGLLIDKASKPTAAAANHYDPVYVPPTRESLDAAEAERQKAAAVKKPSGDEPTK